MEFHKRVPSTPAPFLEDETKKKIAHSLFDVRKIAGRNDATITLPTGSTRFYIYSKDTGLTISDEKTEEQMRNDFSKGILSPDDQIALVSNFVKTGFRKIKDVFPETNKAFQGIPRFDTGRTFFTYFNGNQEEGPFEQQQMLRFARQGYFGCHTSIGIYLPQKSGIIQASIEEIFPPGTELFRVGNDGEDLKCCRIVNNILNKRTKPCPVCDEMNDQDSRFCQLCESPIDLHVGVTRLTETSYEIVQVGF